MKRISVEIGVNESRVSQLHARAIQRLRKVLSEDFDSDAAAAAALGAVLVTMPQRANKRATRSARSGSGQSVRGVVLRYPKPVRTVKRRPAPLPAAAAR